MIEFYWSGQQVAHSPQKAPGPEGGQWGAASQHLTTVRYMVRGSKSRGEDPHLRDRGATANLWPDYLRPV